MQCTYGFADVSEQMCFPSALVFTLQVNSEECPRTNSWPGNLLLWCHSSKTMIGSQIGCCIRVNGMIRHQMFLIEKGPCTMSKFNQ